MDPLTIAAIISGGVGLVSNALQNRGNRKATERQNAYNTPAAQMNRYRAAGLNPNLIYSQGNSGNQATATPYEAPSADPVGILNKAVGLSAAKKQRGMMDTESLLQQQQIRMNDAHIANTYAKTYNEEIKGLVQRLRSEEMQASQPYWQSNAKYKSELNRLGTARMQAQGKYFDQNAKYQTDAAKVRVLQMLREMDVKKAAMLNMDLDRQIKGQILGEKKYYTDVRSKTGAEKTDWIGWRKLSSIADQGVRYYDWYRGN